MFRNLSVILSSGLCFIKRHLEPPSISRLNNEADETCFQESIKISHSKSLLLCLNQLLHEL